MFLSNESMQGTDVTLNFLVATFTNVKKGEININIILFSFVYP